MKRILSTGLILVFSTLLFASPGQVEFVATVDSIMTDTDFALLTFNLPGDFTLTVRVTDETQIRDEESNAISLSEFVSAVEPGTTVVRIEGVFTDEGVLAEQVEIVEDENQFEIRGILEAADSEAGTITVQGFLIEVPEDAEIKNAENEFITLADLETLFNESEEDVFVKVEGFIEEGAFVANEVRVRVGEDVPVRVTFRGIVVAIDEEASTIDVLIEGLESPTTVIITEETDVKGDLSEGVLVLVIGTLEPDLSTRARKIIVKRLLQLAPRELRMRTNQTRRVQVILRNPLDRDVELAISTLNLVTVEPETLTIPAGQFTRPFHVTSGSEEGETTIMVQTPPELGGLEVTLEVEVEDRGRPERELRVRWVPNEVRMGTNQARNVRLRLNQPAADDLIVTLEQLDGEDLVDFPAEVMIGAGSRGTLVEIMSHSDTGETEIRATLPGDGDSDDLEVNVRERGPLED